jgi:hypothetical protein
MGLLSVLRDEGAQAVMKMKSKTVLSKNFDIGVDLSL